MREGEGDGTTEGSVSASEGNVVLGDVELAKEGEGGCCTLDDASGSSSLEDALSSILPSLKAGEVLTSCP